MAAPATYLHDGFVIEAYATLSDCAAAVPRAAGKARAAPDKQPDALHGRCRSCFRAGDEALLLCCGCDRGFHVTCVAGLVEPPEGKWLCGGCGRRRRWQRHARGTCVRRLLSVVRDVKGRHLLPVRLAVRVFGGAAPSGEGALPVVPHRVRWKRARNVQSQRLHEERVRKRVRSVVDAVAEIASARDTRACAEVMQIVAKVRRGLRDLKQNEREANCITISIRPKARRRPLAARRAVPEQAPVADELHAGLKSSIQPNLEKQLVRAEPAGFDDCAVTATGSRGPGQPNTFIPSDARSPLSPSTRAAAPLVPWLRQEPSACVCAPVSPTVVCRPMGAYVPFSPTPQYPSPRRNFYTVDAHRPLTDATSGAIETAVPVPLPQSKPCPPDQFPDKRVARGRPSFSPAAVDRPVGAYVPFSPVPKQSAYHSANTTSARRSFRRASPATQEATEPGLSPQREPYLVNQSLAKSPVYGRPPLSLVPDDRPSGSYVPFSPTVKHAPPRIIDTVQPERLSERSSHIVRQAVQPTQRLQRAPYPVGPPAAGLPGSARATSNPAAIDRFVRAPVLTYPTQQRLPRRSVDVTNVHRSRMAIAQETLPRYDDRRPALHAPTERMTTRAEPEYDFTMTNNGARISPTRRFSAAPAASSIGLLRLPASSSPAVSDEEPWALPPTVRDSRNGGHGSKRYRKDTAPVQPGNGRACVQVETRAQVAQLDSSRRAGPQALPPVANLLVRKTGRQYPGW